MKQSKEKIKIDSQKSLLDRITVDPGILTGKPIIRGMRISVEQILRALSLGMSYQEILKEFPVLDEDDILAVLRYAYESIAMEKIYPIKQAG
jgi:uncharacterized protein (DUF433 family)